MRSDKEKAIELRLLGKSYKQIQRELNIPLGTLGFWFQNKPWSQEIRDRLSQEVSLSNPKALDAMASSNKMRWAQWRQSHREAAIAEFPKIKHDPLFLSGLMLYWGEGQKNKGSTLKLSNGDPAMIKIFYLFLNASLNIPPEKISLNLIRYPDLSEDLQKTIWSKATGIPLSQFKRSVLMR